MSDYYQNDYDLSFHGWDSFKIGPFENKFNTELLEKDYSPFPTPILDGDSFSNKPVTNDDTSLNKTLTRIKIKDPSSNKKKPSLLNTLKKQNASHRIPLKQPKKRRKKGTKNKKEPRRRKKGKRKGPVSVPAQMSVIVEFLSRPGRNLSKGVSVFMNSFKRNIRRMGSGGGWLMPMLDFLKRPGDYYSNFNTYNGAGSGGGKKKKKRPTNKKPSRGKGTRRPGMRPGSGASSGLRNPLGAVTGVLRPVTSALGGALGGAAAAVGGAVGGALGGMSDAASGAMQGVIGDGSLSRKVVYYSFQNEPILFSILDFRIL